MELPIGFTERMRALLGAEADAFFASFEEEPVRALRWNTLKGEDRLTEYADFPVSRLPFHPHGYAFENDRIGSTWLHRAGAIYVQEPAAMTPVSCVRVGQGSRVLDLCASPGGKSTQLAAMLGGTGVLVSNEYVSSRCAVLAQNLERLGVRRAVVTNLDAHALAAAYPGFFDLTVVDAPCSGEGMMRKNPLAVSEWSPENVRMCAERQRDILTEAVKTVRPGGRLLYSTCTFSPEENEENVAFLLERFPELKLIPVESAVEAVTSPGIGAFSPFCRRCYPHKMAGEGQFMALFRKQGGEEEEGTPAGGRGRKEKKTKPDPEEPVIRAFLEETLTRVPDGVPVHVGENWYLSPGIPVPSSGTFENGVRIGSVQKGRVVPHQWFFSAYGTDFRRRLDLDPSDPRLAAYFHGEEIAAPDLPDGEAVRDGIAVLTVRGIPVGGVRLTAGRAKNLYPKGLRT